MQKIYRLTNSRSFDVIYKRGKGISEESMALVTLASKYPSIKVGFVVGKKVGKSVVRNKVKRKMREAFRQLIPKVSTGYSYILIAKASAAALDYRGISSTIEKLLIAADRLKQ